MVTLPDQIFRSWGHSFEEDAGDQKVFRPSEYNFPRARGRAGMEFLADGKFIDWAVGRGDAQQSIAGRWQMVAPGRVMITFPGGMRAPRHLEILDIENSILKVRET